VRRGARRSVAERKRGRGVAEDQRPAWAPREAPTLSGAHRRRAGQHVLKFLVVLGPAVLACIAACGRTKGGTRGERGSLDVEFAGCAAVIRAHDVGARPSCAPSPGKAIRLFWKNGEAGGGRVLIDDIEISADEAVVPGGIRIALRPPTFARSL